MSDPEMMLEAQIDQWRAFLTRRQAIQAVDVAELEDHLRAQVDGLVEAGLAPDEAFLVAVKRMGNLDALSREFAEAHSDRLWKQLVVSPAMDERRVATTRQDGLVAFGVAVLVGVLIRIGIMLDLTDSIYVRNVALVVLPPLSGYFVWKRRLAGRTIAVVVMAFVAAAILANLYPLVPQGSTEILTALHLPIALWLAVGIAYAGGRWHAVAGRMDFIRFSGELFIYFVLIALGGGMLTGFMAMIFQAIGIDIEPFFEGWMPSLVGGAVIIAAWLVEAKQSVIENMAPVLTRLFTPLVTLVVLAFLGTVLWTGRGVAIEREALLAFDMLLLLVLALVLYSLSARDSAAPVSIFDRLQVVLLVSALLADGVALSAIIARISEWGFTPNRTAVLGINLLLLVNLAWSTVLYTRFVRGRVGFATLEKWQTDYLPAYAAWAAVVVVVFPLVFGYV
ncbi:MAG TPA: permease prefix domain 1-containing protein [Gemmatimonadales bacterium]|nr:permease prefix domain 1-containing protein [Gemmatimonadales bacterium]